MAEGIDSEAASGCQYFVFFSVELPIAHFPVQTHLRNPYTTGFNWVINEHLSGAI